MMLKQSPFQPFGHVASGGGGNATVPNDAPIQPPQAFVDANISFLSNYRQGVIALGSKGITSITTGYLSDIFGDGDDLAFLANRSGDSKVHVNLQGNSIGASVDEVLHYMFISNGAGNDVVSQIPGSLDLSGNTNATPLSGAANPTIWKMAALQWVIKFNLHGVTVTIDPANALLCDFSGNSMSAGDVNVLLAFLVANHLSMSTDFGGITLDLSGGTNAAPTGQGIVDKATLIANGWTVTTN